MKKLFKFSGTFTLLKGTDKIVFFSKIDTRTLRGALELYEVILYRKMRRVIDGSRQETIHDVKQTHTLIAATAVHRILQHPNRAMRRVVLIREYLGAFYEALKLLHQAQNSHDITIDARFLELSFRNGFRFLHGTSVDFASSAVLGATNIYSKEKILPVSEDTDTLGVINLIKSDSSLLWSDLRNQFEAPFQRGSPIFVLARTSTAKGIWVQDVLDRCYLLPDLAGLQDWCSERELNVSIFHLPDLDRDFLLPFDGPFGVSLLYISSTKNDWFLDLGFSRLADFLAKKHAMLPAVFEMAALKNQDKVLSEPLPLDENYKAPDWDNWMKSEIWNPKEVTDWSGGHGALDPFAFSHYLRSNDRAAANRLRDALRNTPEPLVENPLSAHGLMYAAVLLKKIDPVWSLTCLFQATVKQRDHPENIAQLLTIMGPARVVKGDPSKVFTKDCGTMDVVLSDAARLGWLIDAATCLNALSLVFPDDTFFRRKMIRQCRDIFISRSQLSASDSVARARDLFLLARGIFSLGLPTLGSTTVKISMLIAPTLGEAYDFIATNGLRGSAIAARYRKISITLGR